MQTFLFYFVVQFKVNLYIHGLKSINMVHYAACQRESRALEVLVQNCKPSDLDSTEHNGRTSLMLAADNEIYENVVILLHANVCNY